MSEEMTREECIYNLSVLWERMNRKETKVDVRDIPLACIDRAIAALLAEPSNYIITERYEDLCKYFGDAKDILKSREEFQKWLDRVKWHIRIAEELYENKAGQRTGNWIKAQQIRVTTYSDAYAECNNCHEPTYMGWWMKFCPHCGSMNGAKMEEQA